MSWRRVNLLLVILAVLAASVYSVLERSPPRGIEDPAIEFYTKTHSASYGGIDRWALYGMKLERVVELLKMDGYHCILPQAAVAGEKLSGIHEMVCNKPVQWPLSRMLFIRAKIDYDMNASLVAAKANSVIENGGHWFNKYAATIMRKAGWIEPRKMTIKGFEIDSIDKLTQFALDALTLGGWVKSCDQEFAAPICMVYAGMRRESGFPALTQAAVVVGNAKEIQLDMKEVHFMPAAGSGASAYQDNNLIVRVADETMWLDFVSQDLTGRKLFVSVGLDSVGGTPNQLVAKSGTETRIVALSGKPVQTNDGANRYLVPVAGTQNYKSSVWLDMPSEKIPVTFKRLAEVIPGIDPIFLPRIVNAVFTSLTATRLPDEVLGLYPALRTIDHRADRLRLANTEHWLPQDQGERIIRQAFHDDPVTRIAWALAMCESATKTPVIDASCWQRFTTNDPEATAFLRSEIDQLLVLYTELEPTHPLRLRLKRLSDALLHDSPKNLNVAS